MTLKEWEGRLFQGPLRWGFIVHQREIGLNSKYKEKWEFIAKQQGKKSVDMRLFRRHIKVREDSCLNDLTGIWLKSGQGGQIVLWRQVKYKDCDQILWVFKYGWRVAVPLKLTYKILATTRWPDTGLTRMGMKTQGQFLEVLEETD